MPTESQAKGYILAEIDVTDTAGYDSYKTLAAKAVSAFGGCYLVRGGSPQVLEGEHGCKRIVILEFPSRERASEFFHSPVYQEAAALRRQASSARFTLLTGG